MAENSPASPIKILIMEAAPAAQSALTAILNQHADFTVVSGAADVGPSHDTVLALRPDVLLLSAELPRVDVLQFLRKLMRLAPIPVLISSTLSPRGADITLSALELGAVDFVAKPRGEGARVLEEYADDVMRKARIAQRAHTRPMGTAVTNRDRTPAPIVPGDDTALLLYRATDQIIAVGAATGGAGAIREILCRLPAEAPAMLVAQPMPKPLSAAFAQRMNSCSLMTVHEAMDGQSIQMGHVYIAPGGQHLLVEREGARYRCRLSDAHPVNHHRPSVDVLLHSVAQEVGPNGIGVILTGAGTDGVMGLSALRDTGAPTLAQDERSSVVWGMAGAAVTAGAVGQVLPLEQIAGALLQLAAYRRDGVTARA